MVALTRPGDARPVDHAWEASISESDSTGTVSRLLTDNSRKDRGGESRLGRVRSRR